MTGPIEGRIPLLYLAPWVDIGGADKGTIDWFRFLDRNRFRASLITTQPSPNRRLAEVAAYARELWELPELMSGDEFPRFILAFIQSRGVRLVHIMNSRLGFDLLPDIASLPDRPRVVVQLHVEEPDCSGYVRYVTTRYGNLVDAFSVSTEALSARLGTYDVPAARRKLIRTGVDAEREFCPARVRPVTDLDGHRLQIAFPARLTAQKDPMLMLEVAERARAAGVAFQIHVLGDGELAGPVRERVAATGLEDEVILHGDCLDLAPWYAACDVVMLTSRFEGLPYVAYEAMAMALPIVAPGLAGLGELVSAETGVLIGEGEGPQGYADALAALAADPARRRRMGETARSLVRSQLSLERMAAEHGALYEELLTGREIPDPGSVRPANGGPPSRPAQAGLRGRRPGAAPLVSVIVPCLDHGRYLPECLASIAEQTYRPIETIVVDDGSTDPETLSALARAERDSTVTVVHLAHNRGPGAARNAAIERASGRYVLPVDADNLLVRTAVADLVEQLSNAGEQIGFVYPNLQFFGNRTDYFEAPSYNLSVLLSGNYCDTSSLIDREVFDRGFRYPEDPGLVHEDWDFALLLAEHGIYGEPARTQTLLFRKRGFSRSDVVDTNSGYREGAAARHPHLFASGARIKGRWNPGLTVIALDPVPGGGDEAVSNLVGAAWDQTCPDFEVIIRTSRERWPTDLGSRLRRIPARPGTSRAQALAESLELARGRYALATYGSPGALLADPGMVEKVLRVMEANREMGVLALATADPAYPSFRLLDSQAACHAILGALCWAMVGSSSPPRSLRLDGGLPLQTLARWLGVHAQVQWRHLSRRDGRALGARHGGTGTRLGAPRHLRARDARFREAAPALPQCSPGVADRPDWSNAWRPPQTRVLYRHLHHPSGRYVYTNALASPPDCTFDYALGTVRALPLPGTTSLLGAGGGPLIFGELALLDDPPLLGFIEQAPLPLLQELRLGRHAGTGQQVLSAGPADPLGGALEEAATVGFIEPYPMQPPAPGHIEVSYGLVGLVRTVDLHARRHRYGAARIPPGVLAGELGALFGEPTGDCDPLWIDDQGRVFAARHVLSNGRPSIATALRWTGAPLTWSRFSRLGPKLRASARRAYESTVVLSSREAPPEAPAEPVGYVLHSPTVRTVPLYGAIHPVTGDQLLSNSPSEPGNLGYRDIALLGHLIAEAPVTGRLGPIRPAAPWASRFGVVDSTP